ncbi:hypothetical protein [Blastomonas sp.]|uniref:hypothetical protein n=1 Tax=Blastomonas sp. TaxID=1909299 RepID=UPI00391A6352
MGLFREPAFDTPCRIAVEQSEAHFHAHVELEGDIAIQPGDKVRVHGAPIIVGFGESILIQRMATVQPAGALMRAWTKLTAMGELKELYEVSFTTSRW